MVIITKITSEQGADELAVAQKKSKPVEIVRLPTGIDILDRNLNGGIPSGSLVYFGAYPRSMPEVFLYELSIPRKTYYITTDKYPDHVKHDLEELDFDTSKIEFIDLHEEYYNKFLPGSNDQQAAIKKVVQFLNDWLNKIEKQDEKNFTIIFDSFSFMLDSGLETDMLKRLMDKIYHLVRKNSSVCYLMIVKGLHDESVDSRIQHWCDVIFDIDIERKGDKIINKLTLPKIRGMTPLTDYIKFKVGDRIYIDTSRDIA